MSNNWIVYHRGVFPPYRLMMMLLSVNLFASKLNGIKVDTVLFIVEKNKIWGAWKASQINNLGKKIISALKEKHKSQLHFSKLLFYINKGISFSEKIIKKDLTKLSNEKIVELYNETMYPVMAAHGLANPDIDSFDIVFNNFFLQLLKNEFKNKISWEKLNEISKQLIVPIQLSYDSKFKLGLTKLLSEKIPNSKKVQILYKKYWWTSLGWEVIVPHKEKYFYDFLDRYKKIKNPQQRIIKIKENFIKSKKLRSDLIKKYNFSPNINYWLNILDRYAYFHELRKRMQGETLYAYSLILREVSKRFNIKFKDLEYLSFLEVKSLLRGKKINFEIIRQRQKACFLMSVDQKVIITSNFDVINKWKKILDIEKKEVQKFAGLPVTKGTVKGLVKVCNGPVEANKKIEKGDILVCGMTTPEYIGSIKKAAAIITDEGGVTCHAAIISREMHKICIVGTHIATHVLKDGDIVEVNANSGVVTIIK
ncbi:MAG: PEP-utilizing enzyme [Candidatus Margulisiibacteriota bacterium]|jgi:phosphohistidine swiveling domain-containing protein